MKRLFYAWVMLFVIVGFSLFAVKSSAQEVASASSDSLDVATKEASVEYTLQYPGILPDNPLYFLKAARDRLISFLISDTQKKAEFNLLTSDKRISAALMLANRDKAELAVSTLSKSNNYLEQSISEAAVLKKSKKEGIDPFLNTLKNAIAKHKDLVVGIKSRVGKKFQKQLALEDEKLDNFAKTVEKLISK